MTNRPPQGDEGPSPRLALAAKSIGARSGPGGSWKSSLVKYGYTSPKGMGPTKVDSQGVLLRQAVSFCLAAGFFAALGFLTLAAGFFALTLAAFSAALAFFKAASNFLSFALVAVVSLLRLASFFFAACKLR